MRLVYATATLARALFLDESRRETIYRSHEKLPGPTATSALSGKVDVCADRRGGVLLITAPDSKAAGPLSKRSRSRSHIFAFDSAFGLARCDVENDSRGLRERETIFRRSMTGYVWPSLYVYSLLPG